jgi:Mg-chelatase subunit ChlD
MKVSKLKKVCNLIIVDSSGSMATKQSDVKGGLLSLFNDIKKDTKAQQHTIIVFFSDVVNVLVNTINTEELNNNIIDNYKTAGMTALYDAIGYGFSLVPKGYDGVFVNIITDGEENSSKEYKASTIKTLVDSKVEDKWGITFMGTTKESITEAKNFGILNTMQFMDSAKGIQTVNSTRSKSREMYMSSVYAGGASVDGLITKD